MALRVEAIANKLDSQSSYSISSTHMADGGEKAHKLFSATHIHILPCLKGDMHIFISFIEVADGW